MKQRTLEILLQHVPAPKQPSPQLEQYLTPATIAADLLFLAYQWGDIDGKHVIDLGCGTGIFSVGAYHMGAKKVQGFDIDKNMIQQAKEYARTHELKIQYHTKDIEAMTTSCDTILMNPPFGAQKANLKADQKFVQKACELSDVFYSLHLKKTFPFLQRFISSKGGTITVHKDYHFPIKWTFSFHEKPVMTYDVILLRVVTHRPKQRTTTTNHKKK